MPNINKNDINLNLDRIGSMNMFKTMNSEIVSTINTAKITNINKQATEKINSVSPDYNKHQQNMLQNFQR